MAYDTHGKRIESEARKRQRERVAALDPSAGPKIANPATNVGAVGDSPSVLNQGKTDQGAWDAGFKPKLGSPWSSAPVSTTSSQPMTRGEADDAWRSKFPTPSLSNQPMSPGAALSVRSFSSAPPMDMVEASRATLGGNVLSPSGSAPDHAAAWSGGSAGWQTPQTSNPLDILKKYQTPGTSAAISFVPGQNNPANLAKRKMNPWA